MVRNIFLGCVIVVGSVVLGIVVGYGLVDLQQGAYSWSQSQMLAAERVLNPATINLPEGQVFMHIDHIL